MSEEYLVNIQSTLTTYHTVCFKLIFQKQTFVRWYGQEAHECPKQHHPAYTVPSKKWLWRTIENLKKSIEKRVRTVNLIPSQPIFALSPWYCGLLSWEAAYTNFIIFDLTWPGLEPMIYHTWDKHANHHTTDAVLCWMCVIHLSIITTSCLKGQSVLISYNCSNKIDLLLEPFISVYSLYKSFFPSFKSVKDYCQILHNKHV